MISCDIFSNVDIARFISILLCWCTWREVVQKVCQACKLNREDAMDYSRWRKLIKDDDQDRREWVNVSSGTGSPG